jgi:hypothetical protein
MFVHNTQSQDNGDEQDELEEKITAAEAQGFTMWLPLAKRLAQTIGVGSNSLHGKMKTAFQMFMSKVGAPNGYLNGHIKRLNNSDC